MLFIKIVVLVFLVAFGWSMGQTPPEGLNAFGKFISMSFFVTAPLLYFLPTIEAYQRDQKNITAIALINTLLGWSLIGWVVAMVWAVKVREVAQDQHASTSKPEPVNAAALSSVPAPVRETKLCPFCAEEVLAAAIKCKHCGSDLTMNPDTA